MTVYRRELGGIDNQVGKSLCQSHQITIDDDVFIRQGDSELLRALVDEGLAGFNRAIDYFRQQQ
ncbi:hypothetical protein D3C81_2252310 [compost metagenome]